MNHRPGRDLQRVGEPGVDRLDVGTELGQLVDGRGDRGGDLRVDVAGVAERRREGDAETGDAVVETVEVVGACPAAATSSPARRVA